VSWQIKWWPLTGDRTVVASGAVALDSSGDGHTGDMKLQNGHYKLFWNFAGEHGFAKQKGVLGGVRRGDAADRHRDPDCHAHAVQLTAAADSPADGNRFAEPEPEPESEPAFSTPREHRPRRSEETAHAECMGSSAVGWEDATTGPTAFVVELPAGSFAPPPNKSPRDALPPATRPPWLWTARCASAAPPAPRCYAETGRPTAAATAR